ncbi:MAG TPA: LacI family DNA-binding transcriptional regulator [Streptosporangiaceae bacterium]|nr:LacI family DNA-binding transcriptional regulator [Streptosporangiaceae bacterium]
MARRFVSIKEVAARAGVSFQTASKVLNGGNVRVSAETAARIMAVAKSLGYRPNTIARSLVRRTTGTIGLIASDATDVAISHFSVAVEQAARRRGYAVLVGHLATDGDGDGADVVRMLIERRVDGVIAAAPQVEDDPEVAELLRTYVPAVSLHHVPGGRVPVVGSNQGETGRLATEHLISHGHRVIGSVTGPFRRRVVRSRLRGYEATMRAGGLEPHEDLVVEADWTPGGGAAATRLLLERVPDTTAIFVHNDAMAIGVLSAVAATGRRVPADVAVVSCDDMPFAEYLKPALSTVRVPLTTTGECAVDLLLQSIAGTAVPAEPLLLPVELINRDSCGCVDPATK